MFANILTSASTPVRMAGRVGERRAGASPPYCSTGTAGLASAFRLCALPPTRGAPSSDRFQPGRGPAHPFTLT